MEYKEMKKDDFLNEVYELTNKSKDDFQKFANQNLDSQDAMTYVASAIISGNEFMTNQTCLALAELSIEKDNIYFQDPQGGYGFCQKNQYEYVKAEPLDETENDIGIDNDFSTKDDSEVQKIYG